MHVAQCNKHVDCSEKGGSGSGNILSSVSTSISHNEKLKSFPFRCVRFQELMRTKSKEEVHLVQSKRIQLETCSKSEDRWAGIRCSIFVDQILFSIT